MAKDAVVPIGILGFDLDEQETGLAPLARAIGERGVLRSMLLDVFYDESAS